jgi:hypothetical protein
VRDVLADLCEDQMKYFVIAIAVMNFIGMWGTAVMLNNKDFTRNPDLMIWDIVIYASTVCWAVYLLGADK